MKEKTKKFKHLIYGEIDVRYDKKKLYFKELQIYTIFFKVLDRDTLEELDLIDDDGNTCINIDEEFEYDELKNLVRDNVEDEVFKEDFLKWIKSIKRHFKGKSQAAEPYSENTTRTSSTDEQEFYYAFGRPRLHRISEIGKPYNISGIKLNLLLQLEDVLVKTKSGYELTEDYKDLGQTVFVDIKNEQGEVYKQKNYVVYTDKGKEFIEGLIEEYISIVSVDY